jgi:tripartite-type tricarboxylate transporter receptor subunit TctC
MLTVGGNMKAIYRAGWVGLFRALLGAGSVAFLALIAGPAWAQAWPAKNITIIVPLAAGTGMDTLVRLYAERLSQALGKPVIVDNRPGAALMLGVSVLAKAAPDGHTLGVATAPAMAINPTLYKQVAYDVEKDFVPIALYVKSPFILVINPALAAHNVPELIKLARESKEPLSYSTSGTGTVQHLAVEFMKQKFGLNITHVPYKNSVQSVTDIMAGHVSMAFAEAGLSLPQIRDGKLRALAVSSLSRLPTLPDMLPIAEAAGLPDFEAVSWHVLLAPAGTPAEIVNRLQLEMKRILAAPDMQQRIATLGLLAIETPSSDGIQQYMRAEREKWAAVVKSLGLVGSQ